MATPFTMEKITRPAAPPVKLRPDYPDQLSKAQPAEKSNLVTWGSPGQSVFELRASDNSTVPEAKWPETQRTYDVVRVYNPDDRSQSIDTEVMTEFQGRNKISQDRIRIRFGQTQNTANSEVISRGNVRKQPGSN
jgi:hypothetical protein